LAGDPKRRLRCTIFDRAKMEELGMGALLGVAQGSHEPPRFILFEYDCGDPNAPSVAIVGKGLTFDAGGISIKPSAKMEEMKFDMCGGAAVLGIMSVLADTGVKVNVIGAVPSTENLPGGGAYKPGDILRSHSGKTIEVQNCDAEGRLILADALSYVARVHKPAAIVDMATLTGAVVIALGHYGAALLSNDDALAARIEGAAARSGDRLWRLPIWEEINDHLKSDYADLKNIADASAGAGTITGAAFLGNFVDGVPWAHIDIAGTAYWEKDRPHLPKGPSGYGVRLIVDLLRSWGK
jgi:leucyl aminopeptidase